MKKVIEREQIFAEIVKKVDENDGFLQLERPLKIKVDNRHIEISTLIDKLSYYDNDRPVTNLVGLVRSWCKMETYDINDYCDTAKLKELLDIVNGVEEEMREGLLLLKFEDGMMKAPELFGDTLSLAGRMKELADTLLAKCDEAGLVVKHDYDKFGSDVLGYHYRRYTFSVPATAEEIYVSCVADNNCKTTSGFYNCRISNEKDRAQDAFNEVVKNYMENYQDAVDDDVVASLMCTHGTGDEKMYVAGYYETKEDKSVESHVAMFARLKL